MEPAYHPCPVCSSPIELRAKDFLRFLPPKCTCANCGTESVTDLRSLGGLVAVPVLGLLFAWLSWLFLSAWHAWPGLRDSWFVWSSALLCVVAAFTYIKLQLAFRYRFRLPLRTVADARTVARCPDCDGRLEASSFSRPWHISCNHCGQRLSATWLSHLQSVAMGFYPAWALTEAIQRRLEWPSVTYWFLLVTFLVAGYFLSARGGMRLRRSA